MRRRADHNQTDIRQGLLDHGRTVEVLSDQGNGCPDLLVGNAGWNFLLEVKNPKGRGMGLTPDQETWHGTWRGSVSVVSTLEEALLATEPPFPIGGRTDGPQETEMEGDG